MTDFWTGAKGVLGTVAPMLATAVGGPLAGAATSAIINALGLAPDTPPEAVAAAVAGATPEQMVALRKADNDFRVQMAQIAAAGDASKRQSDIDHLKAFVADDAGQTDVNKTEASSISVFVAGWRPFIGWVCGTGLLWAFVAGPACAFFANRAMPGVDMGNLLILVGNLLGLAGLRTYEKTQGVTAGH